jgi:Fe-S-cluster-containing hydrogenase component 2
MDKASGEAGVVSLAELRASPGYPSGERLESGPVAVIECVQEIPCDPCESACRFNAIVVGKPITNLPRLLEEKCRGCGECIPACPGLAIFLVNRAYSPEEAAVSMPYEYLPLPEVGSTVDALTRRGEPVCGGRVIRVTNPKKNDSTVVVTIAVPKRYSDQVRSLRVTSTRRTG